MLLKKMLHWFAPPVRICSDEEKYRVLLLNGMINAGIIFVLLVIIGNLIHQSTLFRNYLIDIIVLLSFLIFRISLTKGNTLIAGIGSSTLGFIMTIVSIVSDGSVRSTAVYLLLVVIIVCGIFYKLIGLIISVSASSLAVFTLIAAENDGLLPTPDYSVSLIHWFFLTITFTIIGGIVFFSDYITQNAFRQAKEEIIERKRIEFELKIVNEELRTRMVEVEKLQEKLREQSIRDPLTDLYNRRYMIDFLSHEIQRAKRENKPLCIVIGDLDHFKSINDAYGHHVGDLFLTEIAQLFRKSIRGSDFVCRYGGEEFLFVMPGATVDVAQSRAEEIRLQIAQLVIRHEEKILGITMSFGVAGFPIHGEQEDEIIIKADKALYNAKRQGRNLVKVWDEKQFS
jgi:diguanylate cyclase (GGDEF)-like protein